MKSIKCLPLAVIIYGLFLPLPATAQKAFLGIYLGGEWSRPRLSQRGQPLADLSVTADGGTGVTPQLSSQALVGVRWGVRTNTTISIEGFVDYGRANYEYFVRDTRELTVCDICAQYRQVIFDAPKIDIGLGPSLRLYQKKRLEVSVAAGMMFTKFLRDGEGLYLNGRPEVAIYIRNANTLGKAFTKDVWKATAAVDARLGRSGIRVGYRRQLTNNTEKTIALDIPEGGAAYQFRAHSFTLTGYFLLLR